MVARHYRRPVRYPLGGNHDKRRIPRREFLVELHLRAELVLGGHDASVGELHLEMLGAELEEAVQLQGRIVRLDDSGALGPRAVVREAPRAGREKERRARKREDGDWNSLIRRTPS